jgi:hypothetical protein
VWPWSRYTRWSEGRGNIHLREPCEDHKRMCRLLLGRKHSLCSSPGIVAPLLRLLAFLEADKAGDLCDPTL